MGSGFEGSGGEGCPAFADRLRPEAIAIAVPDDMGDPGEQDAES